MGQHRLVPHTRLELASQLLAQARGLESQARALLEDARILRETVDFLIEGTAGLDSLVDERAVDEGRRTRPSVNTKTIHERAQEVFATHRERLANPQPRKPRAKKPKTT